MALADLAKPEVQRLLRQPLFASLATINPDGSPHLTVMWFTWRDGAVLLSTTKDRVKYRNLVRNPQVALSIIDPEDQYRFVAVSGRVQLSEEGAADLIREEAVRYMGEEQGQPAGEEMARQARVVVRLTPDRVFVYGY
jgi:PPOX class probable F420-dependent enzyme